MIRKFIDLKIAAKLIMGFIIIALIACAVGIVGLVNIVNINKADTQLYQDNTKGIQISSQAGLTFQQI